MLISYQKTPFQEIHSQRLDDARVRLLVKLEYLNHPKISGNKWWKLKYNLEQAISEGEQTLLSFGGSYSNHIYALAAAAWELNMKSIGIIRGDEVLPLNPTLSFARKKGMTLHYVSREAYRKKQEPEFIKMLQEKYGNFYLIPEGGTNTLAVRGCREFGEQLVQEIDFDYVCLPVGTGGTMAGIVSALRGNQRAIGFSVLKDGGFLEEEVRRWVKPIQNHEVSWRIETRYHFGGYAKTTLELSDFIDQQQKEYGLALDAVYTAKALFGIYDLVYRGEIEKGSVVLMLHTGGLQGMDSAK